MPETDRPLTPEERQEAARLCAEMPMGPMEHYLRRVIRRALATITALERELDAQRAARATAEAYLRENAREAEKAWTRAHELDQARATAYAGGQRAAIDRITTTLIALGYLYEGGVNRIKPTHGSCCTCQDCGFYHDDCHCQSNELWDALGKMRAGHGPRGDRRSCRRRHHDPGHTPSHICGRMSPEKAET